MLRSVWRPIATISVLFLTAFGFIFYFASHPEVRHQLEHTPVTTLVTIFALYLMVLVALSLVTYTTLLLCKIKLKLTESSLLTMYATVINFFGPLQSGPAFRGVYLKRKHGLDLKQYTLATLVFYALYAFVSGVFLFSSLLGWWLLVFGILAIIALVWLRRSRSAIAQKFQKLNLNALYALAGATLLQLSLVAIIYFVELHSLSSSIRFSQAVVYAGAANFALFVSLTPGAIGFRESFLLFSQHLHHVPSNLIVAANVIDRAMYVVLLGVISVVIFGTHAQRQLHVKKSPSR